MAMHGRKLQGTDDSSKLSQGATLLAQAVEHPELIRRAHSSHGGDWRPAHGEVLLVEMRGPLERK